MSDSEDTGAKCPVHGCDRILVHYELLGMPSPADPLHIEITQHVYECEAHGLLAYLGYGTFRRIFELTRLDNAPS